jgi:hypothetical protein
MASTINADNGVSSGSAGLKESADSSGVLALQTNGTTALTIDTSQNATFVGTATATKLIPTGSSVTGNGLYLPAANSLGLSTNGTNAVYIDSSQNVGIGTSSPEANAKMTVFGNGIAISTNSASVSASGYDLKIRSSTSLIGIHTDSNSGVPTLEFGNGGSGYCTIKGTAAVPMTFQTNSTERMRIDSSGYVLINKTSATTYGAIYAQAYTQNTSGQKWLQVWDSTVAAGSCQGLYVTYSAATPNGTTNEFLFCTDSTAQRFVARANGGLANYSGNNVNLSDRREKTNFAPAKSYLDVICNIPVQTFNYIDQNLKDDPGLTLGVVAQDVQAIAPELVSESNWGTKEEPKMRLSIYQTDLQYALMKCIQEQQALITALTARIKALEAK